MNKIIKKLVSREYDCEYCILNEDCELYKDRNTSIICPANDFAKGVYAAYKRLAKMPWDEAIKEIGEASQSILVFEKGGEE